MAILRKKAKKSKKMHHKRRRYRYRRQGNNGAFTLSNKFNHLFLPDRMVSWFENSVDFYLPAGNMVASNGNYMDICVNSFYQPFNTSYPINTSANAYSMHGAFTQGYSTTVNPVGYSSYATLYTSYKVLDYEIQLTLQPQNSGDTTEICIFPVGNEEIPSATAGNVNMLIMKGQPRNKSKIVANAVSFAGNTLVFKEAVYTTLGRRKSQWLNVDPTTMGFPPLSADKAYVGVYFQPLDGANNASVIVARVILKQRVEFTDLLQPIS